MSLILIAAVVVPVVCLLAVFAAIAEVMFNDAPAGDAGTKPIVEPSRVPTPVTRSGDFRIIAEFAKSL